MITIKEIRKMIKDQEKQVKREQNKLRDLKKWLKEKQVKKHKSEVTFTSSRQYD